MSVRNGRTSDGDSAPTGGDTLQAPIDREPSAAIRFMIDLARFGGRQLVRHRAPQLAAALAYRTIFSLIPVLVLSLVIFKAFLGPDGVRRGLENVMVFSGISEIRIGTDELEGDGALEASDDGAEPVPARPDEGTAAEIAPAGDDEGASDSNLLAETIQDFVDGTASRIQTLNFGAITVVGVLVLVYAALTLIVQVEQAFNVVCRAPSGRKWVARFLTYWSLLTLGPVLLVGGIILSNLTLTRLDDLPGWLSWAGWPLHITTKFGLTWIILILSYSLLPNTKVMLRPAAIGALVATILWETLKSGLGRFGGLLTDSGTQFAVYGSLALIPLFMLWVYVTWLIVLFGLELAFALQTVATGRVVALERRDGESLIDSGMAVLLVTALAEGFGTGRATPMNALGRRTGLPEPTIERVLERLRERGFVHRVDQGKEGEAFALARSPETISAAEVIGVVDDLSGWAPGGSGASDNAILRQVRGARSKALDGLTIAQLTPSSGGGA